MRTDRDVIVLGGGVIGLACALALRRDGRSVTVLEKSTLGGATSHGNCGTITPSHAMPLAMPGLIGKALKWMWQADAPFYLKPRLDLELMLWLLRFSRRCNWVHFKAVTRTKGELLRRSRELLAEWVAREQLDCGFEERGTLNVFRDAAQMAESRWLVDALREIDMPAEVWDGAQCRAREPALNDSIVGGYFYPGDAHLRPDRYAAELARVARDAGVEFHEHRAATAFDTSGDRIDVVHTTAGELRAKEIVFALGAWTPAMGRLLGLRVPIQPGKGYSITFERPAICPATPVVLKERSVCVTAWKDGYRLGSTMEFSGYDSSLNRTRLDALVRAAGEYLRDPVGPMRQEEWYGWRPMTHDDMPIIGRSRRWRNLVFATGHGMLGVSLSPVTAELVTEIVAGRRPSLDLAPYDPHRFSL